MPEERVSYLTVIEVKSLTRIEEVEIGAHTFAHTANKYNNGVVHHGDTVVL